MTNKEKFLQLVSTDNQDTIDAIRYRQENKTWLRESKRVAVKVLLALKDQGITQRELAERMGVSPQYVNKLVKGRENLTLETICKLQDILQIKVLDNFESEKEVLATVIKMPEIRQTYRPEEYSEYSPHNKMLG